MSKNLKIYSVYFLISLIPIIFRDTVLIEPSVLKLLAYLPYMILLVVSILGLKLNQTRIFFSSIYLLGIYIISQMGQPSFWLINTLALSLPFSVIILYLFKETPFGGNRTLIRLLLSLSPVVALVFMRLMSPTLFNQILNIKLIASLGVDLAQLSILGLLSLFAMLFLFNDKKVQTFFTGLSLCFIPLYYYFFTSMGKIHEPYQGIIEFLLISMILSHCIYQMYWQRVYIDELTEIPNRRALDEKINSLSGEYAIAMIDIDHFKKFNDTFGHDEGDNVLRLVAKIMSRELKNKVYRYGGEEFAAVFSPGESEKAKEEVDRAREILAKKKFFIRKQTKSERKVKNRGKSEAGRNVTVTISIGISIHVQHTDSAQDIIKKADNALYKAKKAGRNRVVLGN